MKRFPTGAAAPALLTIFAASAPTIGVACIPSPDVSVLPPYDGGGVAQEDSAFPTGEDSAIDSTIIAQEAGPGEDTGLPDAPQGGTGTINGIVIDYTQAEGRGVVPNATVSVTVPSNTAATPLTTTADANGLFSIAGVPAGVALEISVSKPTDLTRGIAYSTSLLVATVNAAQTLSLFPVLHEGCFQITSVLDGGGVPVTLQNATCPESDPGAPAGAYAAMTFGVTSFVDSQGIPWSGDIRVDMIPLAYPSGGDGPLDLSWALGLPTGTSGAGTPAGLLGAVEYRVYTSDPGQTDDGAPLFLNTSGTASPVSIAVPVYTAPTATTPLAYSFNSTIGAWSAESATPGPAQTSAGGVQYEMLTVPHLTWWAVTNGPTATTCVTGTLQGTSGNVFVRAAGTSYLGAAAAVTDTTGTFCLDVNAATEAGPATAIQIYARAMEGPVPYGAPANTSYSVTSLAGGTCASGTGCEALGALTLAPLLSCVSGTASLSGSPDAAAPSPLTVFETFSDVSVPAEQAGIQATAYLGQVTVGSDGSFCALGVPGGNLYLVEGENENDCPASNSVTVTSGSNAPVCSAGGCVAAGTLTLGCF